MGIRVAIVAGAITLGLLTTTTASADTIVHEINLPFAAVVFNECSLQFVAVEGTVDLIAFITPDAAGGVHTKDHIASKGQGVTIAAPLIEYRYSEELDIEFTFAGAITLTQTLSLFLVAAGPTDNFLLQMALHTTFNGTGAPTAAVDHFQIKCAG